ncbi:hypothetical protein [Xanthomonas arboricola]|uniref:hypothetical protein n=1 Tax=Xanthomonas arboricola TaxID=56448 RepID=UPI00141B5671|nr:hypothetical protein [Xanthomonas arboricola]NIK44412.1 hypothetical protein [Xanthomonas arboricola]
MNLISGDDKAFNEIDRPLIAYAFLAQTKSDPSDLMSGLAPIFIPIAKQLQGETFSADIFSEKLREIYGIKIHPWAVEDLTPRLEACGILIKAPLSEDAVGYIYSIPESSASDEVTEAHIRALLSDFCTYAGTQFDSHSLSLSNEEAEKAFLEHLVLTDFSSIRTRASSEKKDPRVLTLKKSDASLLDEAGLARRAQLDVICAAYIIDVLEKNREAYDLIVRVAHGALLAEVVLNVQNPESKIDLKQLTVILDAPLAMSVLDVRAKESTQYARAFVDELKAKGAAIKVFLHSVEEIEFNIRSVIEHVAKGAGHGATARRLVGSNSFRIYLESVRSDVRGAIERADIKVIDAPSSPQYLQEFSEDDEASFQSSLGIYNNYQAQIRDAKSVASVIRLRRGSVVDFKKFQNASYIFVTENDRVAERSGKFMEEKRAKNKNPVPPVLTDRFFAGMMWVTFGGKTDEITQHRLLANCVSALEPRTDVLTKVHQFLSELDKHKADHFRALMTEDRSGQHVMQLTLGDALLVRSTEDASELLKKLEEKYFEKSRNSLDEEIQKTRQEYEEEMTRKLAEHDETVRLLSESAIQRDMETSERIAELESVSRNDAFKIGQLEDRINEFQQAIIENSFRAKSKDLINLKRAVISANRVYRAVIKFSYVVVIFAIAMVAATPLIFEFKISLINSLLFAAVSVVIASLGFWRIPDATFGRMANALSRRELSKKILEYSLEDVMEDSVIDIEKGTLLYKGKQV